MSFSNFKKDAKNKLDGYRPEVDAEALWAQLEPQIPKKENKDRFFFWLFLGSLAIGLAAFGWWYSSPPVALPAPKPAINIAQNPNTTSSEIVQKQIDPETNTQANPQVSKPINKSSSTLAQTKKPTKTTTAKITKESNPNSFVTTTRKTATIQTEATKNIIATTPLSKILFQKEKEPSSKNILSFSHANKEGIQIQASKRMASLSIFEKLALKKINWPLATPERNTPLILAAEESDRKEEALTRSKNKWQWTLGLSGGAGHLDQKLSLKDPRDQKYLEERLITEKNLEALHGALNFQVKHRSGVYLQTGLEYARMATRYYKKTQKIDDAIYPDGIKRIYTNFQTGDTTWVLGPVPFQEISESTKTRYNNFHTLNIPLMVGYQLSQKKWSFGIEAGVLVNAYLQKSGSIAAQDLELYNLGMDEQNWFKNNLGIRPMVAIQAGYRIRPDWEIYLSPQFRSPVKINTAGNPIDQSFSSLEMAAGIRFRL